MPLNGPGPPQAQSDATPFQRMVEHGADGVAILDASGVIVYANPAASALLGRPLTQLIGRPLGLPVVAFQSAEIDVPTTGDSTRIVELRSAEGIWDGRPALLVGLRDVTAYRRLADSQRFLARAGAELAHSLDLPTTVARIAQLVIEDLADGCLIDLIQADGSVHRPIARHATAELDALLNPLRDGSCVDLNDPIGLPRALRTGRPKIYNRTTESALDSLATDPVRRQALRKLGIGSIMILPLIARDRTLGALTLLTTRPGHFFSAADLPSAGELATLAALAIDNARLYDEARDAVRRRDEFLAMLSHELRNPLSSIIHAANLIQSHPNLQSNQTNAIEVVARQSQQMSRLLDDLLDISRVTRGIIHLERQPVDLLDVLEQALESARPAIEASHHRLQLNLPGNSLAVVGDQTRLVQVLVNLLTNAARYTPPGGEITLEIVSGPQTVELVVRDTGIGIEPEFLPRIFDLFAQGRRGLDRSQGGLGIGLTLVREIVELHDGSISAFSDGPGLGSTFRVRLPVADVETLPLDSPNVPAPQPAQTDRSPLRILLVEDHADNREMLRTLLTLNGHQIETAADGLAALEALRQRPDLALIDIGLPGIDGLTLARIVRSDPDLSDLPLIAVTGYARPEDRTEALDAGFDDHLPKPVRLEDLKRLLDRLPRRSDS
ncbi:hybrid sensor histidine kinase/response regulator [Tautonia rosea]|uniref:hybrid sensor histidine kinase/response regulator n=1 Tax=Tautonia rosea TaxID=2728037 RepID=UPI0014732024|nr:ATP-binding protein [Tautonia rosea]